MTRQGRRYHELKKRGRCACGRLARKGRVQCGRCAAAGNKRSKKRYSRLSLALRMVEMARPGTMTTLANYPSHAYPHHD